MFSRLGIVHCVLFLRACSHGGGVPQFGGAPSVSIYSLLFICLCSHARWGTPLRRATRLLGAGYPSRWGTFFPCERSTPGSRGEVHPSIRNIKPAKNKRETKITSSRYTKGVLFRQNRLENFMNDSNLDKNSEDFDSVRKDGGDGPAQLRS